jgi:DNA-binding beta-propeller fold protein YncE
MIKKLSLLLSAAPSLLHGGTLLYIGAWPHNVYVIDESTYQVVKRIEMKTDVPRNLVLTADKSKLVVTTIKDTGIEVVDLAKSEVIDSFILGGGNTRVNLAGIAIDPTGNLLYTNLTRSKKLIDRWDIGLPTLAIIDLKQHKVIKEVEVPAAERAQASNSYRGGNYRVSPDGKLLYQFGNAINIYDTTTLKKLQTIELAKPQFPGMENITFSPEVDPNDDPNTVTGIFNTEDPEVHRAVFGIATFHLNERKFDFSPIGPAVQGVSNVRYTADHKKAYAVSIAGTHGDRHCEFWAIDAASSKLTQREEFPCRPRFSFATSSSGNELFIYAAGFELDVYDAATMKFKKSLNLEADITTSMVTVTSNGQQSVAR